MAVRDSSCKIEFTLGVEGLILLAKKTLQNLEVQCSQLHVIFPCVSITTFQDSVSYQLINFLNETFPGRLGIQFAL